jgi:hypothetical protein
MTSHYKTLFLELLGNIAGRGARDLDPGLGEDSAGDEHVYDEDSGLEGIRKRLGDAERGRPIIVSVLNCTTMCRITYM